jgi:hypothetical protein
VEMLVAADERSVETITSAVTLPHAEHVKTTLMRQLKTDFTIVLRGGRRVRAVVVVNLSYMCMLYLLSFQLLLQTVNSAHALGSEFAVQPELQVECFGLRNQE